MGGGVFFLFVYFGVFLVCGGVVACFGFGFWGFWKKVPVHLVLNFLISECVFLAQIGFPMPLATVKRTHWLLKLFYLMHFLALFNYFVLLQGYKPRYFTYPMLLN